MKHYITLSMDTKRKYRTIVFFKDYFERFFIQQTEKVKARIIWTLNLIEDIERIPEVYFKHIESTNGIYEIRIKLGSDIYRIFCFFNQGKLIILANGFKKKSQKTPKKEIVRALKIREEYENENK